MFVSDRLNGYYFDPVRLHTLAHRGKHLKVRGALNIGRSPRGRPVIVRAGASSAGREFAAEESRTGLAGQPSCGAGFAAARGDRLRGRVRSGRKDR